MTKKGREFNEIYDLTAMRVIVESVKDCYGAIGIIHALWKPLPGRFKDFIATPKLNLYEALHTTVIGPEGRPLEIQIRTPEMHELAEFGIAAHVIYKEDGTRLAQGSRARQDDVAAASCSSSSPTRTRRSSSTRSRSTCSRTRSSSSRRKGEVKKLSAGSTPLDFAYAVHTDVGHRCVGAKVNAKIVPLHYQLRSGDIVEILTAKQERGPSRDWLSLVRTSRARNKIRAFLTRERREDAERRGREKLQEALRKRGLPAQKVGGSELLVDVAREMGFRKADDFYVGIGQGKISPKTVANKVFQRLKAGEAVGEEEAAETDTETGVLHGKHERHRATVEATDYGIKVEGVEDVMVRLAKCCRPVPGDPIVGYVSLGRGITIHREDCKNVSRADEGAGALHRRLLGRRQRHLLPRRAPGRRDGPHATARGPLAHVRRGGDQHPRGDLRHQAPDGQEPLRRRGRRHQAAQAMHHEASQPRLRLRRLPRHSDLRV